MKEIIKTIRNGVMESLPGYLVTFIKETMRQILEMVMVRCIGQMDRIIKGSGWMVFNMEKVIVV